MKTPAPRLNAANAESPCVGGQLGLALVIILNGLLIVRPEEVYPALAGLRLYYLVTLVTLMWFLPSVIGELFWGRLSRHPLLFAILGIHCAVVASHLGHFRLGRAVEEGGTFTKVVLYYLLVVVAISNPSRLKWFLIALGLFIAAQTTLGLAQYYQYVNIEALKQVEEGEIDPVNGERSTLMRLCGSGIYNDPNDLALILCAGVLICLYRLGSATGGSWVLWLPLLLYFAFALTLTRSRGGLLAAGAGLLTYVAARYGVRWGAVLGLIAVPVAMLGLEGRQTRFDLSQNDTSQDRIRLWSEGFAMVPSDPIFGIGAGDYADHMGLVAHNSFVHAYVELGLPGGSLFLAAFVLAFWGVAVTRPSARLRRNEVAELIPLRPLILGLLASYMTGMFSLSRDYIAPTYLSLALAAVYVRMAAPNGTGQWYEVNGRMLVRIAALGACGFIFLKLFIALFVRYE